MWQILWKVAINGTFGANLINLYFLPAGICILHSTTYNDWQLILSLSFNIKPHIFAIPSYSKDKETEDGPKTRGSTPNSHTKIFRYNPERAPDSANNTPYTWSLLIGEHLIVFILNILSAAYNILVTTRKYFT